MRHTWTTRCGTGPEAKYISATSHITSATTNVRSTNASPKTSHARAQTSCEVRRSRRWRTNASSPNVSAISMGSWFTPAAHQVVAGRRIGEKSASTSGNSTAGRGPNRLSSSRSRPSPKNANMATISAAG